MGQIKAKIIIEIMGRPAEHLKESMNLLVEKLAQEKGIVIIDKKLFDPKPLKDSKDLFTSFTELDIDFESLESFFAIVMGYMPSNVEIYEPDKLKINLSEINALSNFMISKLHRYDEIAKRALIERDMVIKQLEFLKNGGKMEDLLKTHQASQNKEKSGSKVKKKD